MSRASYFARTYSEARSATSRERSDKSHTSEPRPGLCFLSFLFREYEDGAAVPIDRVSEDDAAWLGTSFTPLFFFENALKMLNLGMITLYGHEVGGVSRVIGGGKAELRRGGECAKGIRDGGGDGASDLASELQPA